MGETGPRTDSHVFVIVHEIGTPKQATTLMQLGRVPSAGEFIFMAGDHCLKVERVIHIADGNVKSFPRYAHDRERPRVGTYSAFVEVSETNAFTPADLEATGET